MKYDPKKIESKWQKIWLEKKIFKARDDSKKPKYYQLETFPYPSAEGLHVGHPKGYIAEDIHARYMRMKGREVLYTMGWDAFGLPTENYAIKVGKSPKEVAEANVKNFKRQVQMFGFSYDWDREINTSHPDYYKWTQWLFIQLFKKGLAYRAGARVNWCPKDQTVLANEQVVDGKCERCGSVIEERNMEQWFLRITQYADRLLADLKGLDWPAATVKRQKDWIGRSEGAELDFEVKTAAKPNFVLLHGYNGSPKKHFFPWLSGELEKMGYKVQVPALPRPEDPRVEEQVAHVLKTVSFDENTVLVGHSLGGIVALKVLERLSKPVRKTILVASFIENKFLDNDTFEPDVFDWNFNDVSIRRNVGNLTVLRDITDDTVPPDQTTKMIEKFYGISLDFAAEKPHARSRKEPEVLRNVLDKITVFTTRPDTLFGATYMVLAPEHSLVQSLKPQIQNGKEVGKYIEAARHKTELMRKEETREKTGVELKGVKAINPATKEEISVWIADYVLMGYGTGAIMAVPAHDERDFEFAKKFNLPIKQVIEPFYVQTTEPGVYRKDEPIVPRNGIITIVKHWSEEKYIGLKWKKVAWGTFITGGIEKGQTAEQAGVAEIREETGYSHPKFIRELGVTHGLFYHVPKKENRLVHGHVLYFELQNGAREEISEEENAIHEVKWLTLDELEKFLTPATHTYALALFNGKFETFTGAGVLMNSDKFDAMDSEKAKWEITKFVGGQKKIQYKIRDWSVSRQRYWGAPIPIIYCDKCGIIPVPEKDLPVLLPEIKNYRPKGVPPLAGSEEFIKIECPQCGGEARRDPETLDTFVDSSWYYLRYSDPQNDKELFDKKKAAHWLPVDLYIIGAEHTVLHLLYSRFITKFLHDQGLLKFAEPFLKLRHQGLILGADTKKMSKSKGNVVNPDTLVGEFGADTVRLYEMFMGPFEDGQPWDPKGVLGTNRFLNRFWNFIVGANKPMSSEKSTSESKTQAIHRAVKKVGEDIENLKFNTAISALMILLNNLESETGVLEAGDLEILVKILHPFAPHMSQELWATLGKESIIDFEPWPEYDSNLIREETVMIVVQINGRVRDSFGAQVGIGKEEAITSALNREKIKNLLGSRKPQKTVYVPNKLINFVL